MKEELFLQGQVVTLADSGWDDVPDGTKGQVVMQSNEGFMVEILEGESKGVNMFFQGGELHECERDIVDGSKTRIIGIRIPPQLLAAIDGGIEKGLGANRSEVVRNVVSCLIRDPNVGTNADISRAELLVRIEAIGNRTRCIEDLARQIDKIAKEIQDSESEDTE